MTDTFAQVQSVYQSLEKWDDILYWEARKIGGRFMQISQVSMLRAFLAYRACGVQVITRPMLDLVLTRDPAGILTALHNLGDRKLITLLRYHVQHDGRSSPLRYTLNPDFLRGLPKELKEQIGFVKIASKPSSTS